MKFGIFVVVAALFYNGCVSMLVQEQPSGEIKDFANFLEKSLQRKVLEYNINPLTKPGDNFGAILQSVDVKVGNDSNNVRMIIIIQYLLLQSQFNRVCSLMIRFICRRKWCIWSLKRLLQMLIWWPFFSQTFHSSKKRYFILTSFQPLNNSNEHKIWSMLIDWMCLFHASDSEFH